MGTVTLTQKKLINAGNEKVWDILGNKFLYISIWASGVTSSKDNPETRKKFSDAPAGGRICTVKGLGELQENILKFDPKDFEITWDAKSSKLPPFVSGIQNTICIKATADGKSEVTSTISFKLSGILGFFMKPIMMINFKKTLRVFLSELADYVVTGNLSEAKKKELT